MLRGKKMKWKEFQEERSEWEEDPPYSSPIFLWALQMLGKKDSCRSSRSLHFSCPSPHSVFLSSSTLSLCRSFFPFLSSVCDIQRGFALRIMHSCCRLCTPGLLNPFYSAHILLLQICTHMPTFMDTSTYSTVPKVFARLASHTKHLSDIPFFIQRV